MMLLGEMQAHVDRRVHVEVLDEGGAPVPDGERGEIVVTVDENPYLPLLRYRTGDHAALVRDEKFSSWLVDRTPSGRWGDVDELGGAAIFLASDASTFVNGHVLYVDGGVTARL